MNRLIHHAIEIYKQPDEVFALISDPRTQMKWQPERLFGIEGEGPPQKGARYRGNFKGFGWMDFDSIDAQVSWPTAADPDIPTSRFGDKAAPSSRGPLDAEAARGGGLDCREHRPGRA